MPKLSPKDMQAALAVAQKAFKEKFTPGFYHGSPSNRIKAFDPTKSNKPEEYITPGVTFLTQNPSFAHDYTPIKGTASQMVGQPDQYATGATIYPVSANLGKKFDFDTPEGKALAKDFLKNKLIPNQGEQDAARWLAGMQDEHNTWKSLEHPDFLQHLKDTGHDSFAVKEAGINNVGIFDAKNIRGKFAKYNPEDAESPDFMKAEGGAVGQYADDGLAHLARGGMLRRGTTYGTPQQQAVNYIAPKPLQATTTAFNKMPSPTPITGGSTTMPGTPPMVPVQKPVVPIQNSKTAATSTVPAGGATFAQAPTQQPLPTPLPTPTPNPDQPGTPSGPSGSAGTDSIASLINSTQQLPGSLTMNVQAAPQQPQPPQPPTQINSVLGNLIGGTIPGIAAGKAGGRVQHFEFGGAVKKALQYARTVPFTHFSHSSNISRLEPSLYGSGIKGAEASRLKDAPDIKPRSYIYVSKENVRPEQGLGPHRYEGVAENMYPLHEDPAGFSAKARELAKDPYFAKMGVEIVDQPKHLNELERQIKNAGYSGYADDNVGLLFNPTDVTKVTD